MLSFPKNNSILILAWLYDLFSNFRLHFTVILIAGIIVNLIFIHSSAAYVIGIVGLIASIIPLSSWRENTDTSVANVTKSFQIMSFNIQWNIETHNQSLQFIQNSEADVIVLQEVTADTRNIIQTWKDKYPYQYGEGHSHVMVLSKHKMKLIQYLDWPGKFLHRALHLNCEIGGELIHIVAIHMQVTRSWKQLEQRERQMDCLTNTLNNIASPMIVIGDFNAGIGACSLRKITADAKLKGKASLLHYIPTWPSSLGMFGIQLDHVFVKGPLAIKHIRSGPRLESDHRALIAQVGFNE